MPASSSPWPAADSLWPSDRGPALPLPLLQLHLHLHGLPAHIKRGETLGKPQCRPSDFLAALHYETPTRQFPRLGLLLAADAKVLRCALPLYPASASWACPTYRGIVGRCRIDFQAQDQSKLLLELLLNCGRERVPSYDATADFAVVRRAPTRRDAFAVRQREKSLIRMQLAGKFF
jgi:hypothetical protein